MILIQMCRDDDLKPVAPQFLRERPEKILLRRGCGLSVERRIKAVFWWCYAHSPEPLSASEILNTMPTDKSIAAIYEKIQEKKQDASIPQWGDAVVWSELHRSTYYPSTWD